MKILPTIVYQYKTKWCSFHLRYKTSLVEILQIGPLFTQRHREKLRLAGCNLIDYQISETYYTL